MKKYSLYPEYDHDIHGSIPATAIGRELESLDVRTGSEPDSISNY
jgi:hypothetical protein